MNLTLKMLWQLHRLNLRRLQFQPKYETPQHYEEIKKHIGIKKFEEQFPLGKENIDIKTVNNCDIINIRNFPRCCGKTTFLTSTINGLPYADKCLYLSTNKVYSHQVKSTYSVNNKYCYFDSLHNFIHDPLKYFGSSFQHFFVDEFILSNGWDKNNKSWKDPGLLDGVYDLTLECMMRLLDCPEKPSYIIFVH